MAVAAMAAAAMAEGVMAEGVEVTAAAMANDTHESGAAYASKPPLQRRQCLQCMSDATSR